MLLLLLRTSQLGTILCYFIAIASSKQRSSLRRSLTSEKKKLKACVERYNQLQIIVSPTEEPLNDEEVLLGRFPWSALTSKFMSTKPLFLFFCGWITLILQQLGGHVCFSVVCVYPCNSLVHQQVGAAAFLYSYS